MPTTQCQPVHQGTLACSKPSTTPRSGPSLPSTASTAVYDKLRNNPVVKLNGDHDVFGDSTVTIIATPDTPGISRCCCGCQKPAR